MMLRISAPCLLLLPTLALSGCRYSTSHPCPDGVVQGNIGYENNILYGPDGLIIGVPGDSPLPECTAIEGRIHLRGDVSHFRDFDNIERMGGFYLAGPTRAPPGSDFPDLGEDRAEAGIIDGFPNLRRIEYRQYEGAPGDIDFWEGNRCCDYRGFEQLEYVAWDFVCRGHEDLGKSLVEVVGTLRCNDENLTKLERVGSLGAGVMSLPSLRWAGRLSIGRHEPGDTDLNLPLLEAIGPEIGNYPGADPPDPPTFGSGLRIAGAYIQRVHTPSLTRVDGNLSLIGLGQYDPTIYVQGRAEELREQFSGVEVTQHRIICHNDPTDPCAREPACPEVYGADSLECCDLTWPECLEIYGGENDEDGS